MNASVRPVPSGVVGQSLTTLPGGLQLQLLSSGAFDVGDRGAGGQRYLSATFKVRNANVQGDAAYADARKNLTFFAASTAATLQGTAVSQLVRFDNTNADPTIALSMFPTHGMQYSPVQNRALVVANAADFQVFTEAEADPANFTPATTAGALHVTGLFPYGFVVRSASGSGRALPGNPGPGQFDGRVTFAYRLPLQATAAADPYQVRIIVQAAEDTQPRVTESLEEQATPGEQTVTQRGAALQGTLSGGQTVQVAYLAGSTYSGANGVRVCQVRTAGTAQAPTVRLGGPC